MWSVPNKIKVKFKTFGYLQSQFDLIHSPSTNLFHTHGDAYLFLDYWRFYLIRERAHTRYTRDPSMDLIFMRGMHKFRFEATLAFEAKVGLKDVGKPYERFAFEDLTVLDDEWEIKLTLEGPTASNFTYYNSPYLSDFLRFNGVWTFTGYKSATITINPQTKNNYHSQYDKPSGAILTTPYKMITEVVCRFLWWNVATFFDNVEVELKRFDPRRNDWVDYPVRLATEHTISIRSYKTPTQPIVDGNKIVVNEGNLQQGVFDDFVYDVVDRTVDGIVLPVRRRNWVPILNDGDIMQTRAPWYSIVSGPDVIRDPKWNWLKLYEGFAYRHYALPIMDIFVREINDLGQELSWSYKWHEASWTSRTAIVPFTDTYEKKPPPPEVYTRPKHISRLEVSPTQVGLIVELNPREGWIR